MKPNADAKTPEQLQLEASKEFKSFDVLPVLDFVIVVLKTNVNKFVNYFHQFWLLCT